jgi:uncharacterized DUF497 family protein
LINVVIESKDARVRWFAVGKLTDPALLAKVAIRDEDGKVREAAVGKLTDQDALTNVVIESKDARVRWFAVGKLTDQALLAKIAIEDPEEYVGSSAAEKLTDQDAVARVAVESKDGSVREVAAKKLTDQVLLAKVAGDRDPSVREVAVRKLTNQALLAKIAIEDPAEYVRRSAAEKLTDQVLLAKVALVDMDFDALHLKGEFDVRRIAAGKLTDQALLAKIAVGGKSRTVRAMAVAAMDESNPALRRLAGNLGASTFDTFESVARVKLAIKGPRIRDRFPRIVFVPRVSNLSQLYDGKGGPFVVSGESVFFELSQAGETLAKKNWITNFPGMSRPLTFLGAEVHCEELLVGLLHNPLFTEDDLAALSSSEIPEVRQAAKQRLGQIRNDAK